MQHILRAQRTVQPPVLRSFDARSATFHKVLCVKVGARRVGGTCGMNDGQVARLIERQQRLHGRVKAKGPIQVEHLVRLDRNCRPHRVVSLFPVRYNQVQTICCASLEEHD